MKKNCQSDDSFLLGVCGPTGAGKSTLGRIIAQEAKCEFLPEPIPHETLEAFKTAPVENGWLLQKEILTRKLDAYRRLHPCKRIVMDRTIAEDRTVFFEMHHTLGFLSLAHLNHLRGLSNQIETEIGLPNAVIFVTAETQVLRKRMLEDCRPQWLIDCLPIQLSLYDAFLRSLQQRHITIDSTQLTLSDLNEISTWICETMKDVNLDAEEHPTAKRFGLRWKNKIQS